MSRENAGYSFLVVPLLAIAIVILLAMVSAGGVDQFFDGLGLTKGNHDQPS